MGFNKCNSPFHHDNSIIQNNFTTLQICFPLIYPCLPLPTPGNHCLYCFAFPEYHINGIVQYTAFSNQHLSFNVSICGTTTHFLLLLDTNSIVVIIVYSSIESYFASFQFLTIMNRAVKYINQVWRNRHLMWSPSINEHKIFLTFIRLLFTFFNQTFVALHLLIFYSFY